MTDTHTSAEHRHVLHLHTGRGIPQGKLKCVKGAGHLGRLWGIETCFGLVGTTPGGGAVCSRRRSLASRHLRLPFT